MRVWRHGQVESWRFGGRLGIGGKEGNIVQKLEVLLGNAMTLSFWKSASEMLLSFRRLLLMCHVTPGEVTNLRSSLLPGLAPLLKRGFRPPFVWHMFHPPPVSLSYSSSTRSSSTRSQDWADQKLVWSGQRFFSLAHRNRSDFCDLRLRLRCPSRTPEIASDFRDNRKQCCIAM